MAVDSVGGVLPHKNPISRVQEICQQWKFPLPVYREAQGTFSEFGTEVSLTLEGELGRHLLWPSQDQEDEQVQRRTRGPGLYITKTKPHLLEPPPAAVRY